MKNRVSYSVIFLFFYLPFGTFAQEHFAPKVEWNGYTQLRFTSDFNDENSFALRRMKLWVNSAPNFSEQWSFHIQTKVSSFQDEEFLLQDVLVTYRQEKFKFNMGQFVPEYSLQRFQSDYQIPLTERADVINALVPNGTLGVRDIGVEGNYSSSGKTMETWLGVFNGYGVKDYRSDNAGIMLTHKTNLHFFDSHLLTGYSIMYRKADNLQLLKILPDELRFSGHDFRYNLFAKLQLKNFHIQSEYLFANLSGNTADGYYILATLNRGKNQWAASWNQYNDLIEGADNSSIVHLGYNYLSNGDKLKFMFDNGAQIRNGSLKNYFATIQLQVFFK